MKPKKKCPEVEFEYVVQSYPHETKTLVLVLALRAGRIAGVVSFRRDERTVEFNRLFVNEQYRCQGVGIQLVDEVQRQATLMTGEPVVSISCMVHPKNDGALAFYRKLGFFEATTLDSGHLMMTRRI